MIEMNDLISRQAAIDAVAEFLYYSSTYNLKCMRAGFDLADWKRKIDNVLPDGEEDTDNE